MNKIKETLLVFKNDGTDSRKNDVWRILLFALNHSGGAAITIMMGKWIYYTQNVLQLGLMFATILLPMRLLDAITDPIIAALFDKFESKYGKFRPFMLIGGLMSIIPALVIFLYPVNPPGRPLWVSFAILGTCAAIITVGSTILMTATRAGQAIITQHPKQRPIYSLGQTISEAIVMGFVTIVLTSGLVGSMQEPFVWRFSVIVLSVTSMVLIFIAMQAIKTRDTPTYYSVSTYKGKTDMTEFFKLLKRSSPIRRLVIATASDALAASIRANLTIYLFANIIMKRSLYASFDIISGAAIGIPVLLVGLFLAARKGSAEVYTKLSLVQTLVSSAGFAAVLIFLPATAGTVYSGLNISIVLVLLVFGIYMSTLGISTNLINAMTGDLTDYEFTQSGKFIPGTVGATLTFCNKVTTSVVGFIVLGIMVFCGFNGTGADAKVPENIFINDRFYFSVTIAVFVLPAIGHLITYLAMRKYPLSGEKMNEVSMQITKQRGLVDKDGTADEQG